MRLVDQLLEEYGSSHQNATNKLIHWFCVPAIMFSLIALLFAIPFFTDRSLMANWAFIFLLGAWMYYARLSMAMLIGFMLIGSIFLWGAASVYLSLGADAGKLAIVAFLIFAIAWVGQFIGHKIEGKKPSFLKDVQFLLVGPAWLLSFIFRKMGIKY